MIAYSAAIRELDNGRYDKSLADGMSIQACIMEAAESGFRLSAMGREGFNLLHDGFIEQIQTEGMPDMPVMH
ncbi:hypothetical protein ABN154_20900 [Klebsiella michiganensis]|uniref:hypothetical protein n=1 Tax=Klebsiella michiganensis TaxID=1134687 RepID=UPI0032DAA114